MKTILIIVTTFSIVHCQAQTNCLNLGFDASVVHNLNLIQPTKDASKFVSAAMIPMAGGLPVILYVSGLTAHDKYLAQTGVMMLAADVTVLGLTYVSKQIFKPHTVYDCKNRAS